jgi:deoxyribodipyrimidine photolyase-related protein
MPRRLRHLIVILGDQLDRRSPALDDFDPARDAVWMAEVAEEATHVWSHKARIALFLTAMRHFRDELQQRGWSVLYRPLDAADNCGSLAGELERTLQRQRPQAVLLVEPGDYRVEQALRQTCSRQGVPLRVLEDRHFYASRAEFAEHARGRKQLRLEFFYREMRRRHDVLMAGDQPEGGAWNFDAENRKSFGQAGPPAVPTPLAFAPDAVTREVLQLVATRFADHPGSLEAFDWPVTPEQARLALEDFLTQRLARFGDYQDAMWTDQPYLYHARISAALNLKLLDPREAVEGAERLYRLGKAPLPAVEGFIRQILGWREYVRGVYWLLMPEYAQRNALNAQQPLPNFYWTGQTDMNCLRQVIGQTLQLGYAHHIQRLMVTGLYALLLGVHPRAVHEWYLAVYVDAVEWVELPNTLGMSQYADGGVMASKPYVASGKYIERMSNYCQGCRYDPAAAVGAKACPFTTLYWDFLLRHEQQLADNPRMRMQIRNAERLSPDRRRAIQQQAAQHRQEVNP